MGNLGFEALQIAVTAWMNCVVQVNKDKKVDSKH
jgi:hypothetical protein